MSNFTSGPWTFEVGDGWHIRDAAGNSLQCNEQYYPWVSRNEADWHLIAAAPEMYEALRAMLDRFSYISGTQHGHLLSAASAALAKAEGKQP